MDKGAVLYPTEVGVVSIGLRLHLVKDHKLTYLLSRCGKWITDVEYLPPTPICQSCFGQSGVASFLSPPDRMVVVEFYEQEKLDV